MITGTMLLERGWTQGKAFVRALEAAQMLFDRGVPIEDVLSVLDEVRANPALFAAEGNAFADLASALINVAINQVNEVRDEPLPAQIWGRDIIDAGAIEQMHNAMRLPVTVGGALMPDAHIGYGIPIGGVVALEDAVAPYMVGVDIACRMMMTVIPVEKDPFEDASMREQIKRAMIEETRFGVGATFNGAHRRQHDVLDDPDWDATKLLRSLKGKGCAQLGTSGSGNHFVDAGILEIGDEGSFMLGVEPGRYLAFMTHSGSRGVGATIADHYSKLAQQVTKLPDKLRHLAWLPLSTEAGEEYWTSMNLAGKFASACHHTIHRALTTRLGMQPAAQVENHHNFAWEETWQGKRVIVHRKGATPAHEGVLGIIPGSQGHNSFIVRGKGSEASLNSASHGAGRMMSRKRAKEAIPKIDRDLWLRERGVELLGGGLDEAPQAYKDIEQVLALQSDLVETLAVFKPKIVLMSTDGKSED